LQSASSFFKESPDSHTPWQGIHKTSERGERRVGFGKSPMEAKRRKDASIIVQDDERKKECTKRSNSETPWQKPDQLRNTVTVRIRASSKEHMKSKRSPPQHFGREPCKARAASFESSPNARRRSRCR
jgi:hypothetical protein